MYEFIILISYRDRLEHLRTFVPHMEKFLAGQSFKIVVIDQAGTAPFNKGKLTNCGFALCGGEADTIIIHDVDSLPRGTNFYGRVRRPTHLAARVSKFGNQFPYPQFFGCVAAVPAADYKTINGFSNEYWGWGREDFEMGIRIREAGLEIDYVDGEYESLPHAQSTWGPLVLARWREFESRAYDWREDGLNSVQFKRLDERPLRDFLKLDVGPQHTFQQVDVLFEQSIIYKRREAGTLPVPVQPAPPLHYDKPGYGSDFEIPDYRFGGGE